MESDEAGETKHPFEIAEDEMIPEYDLVKTHYISKENCETETNDELPMLRSSYNNNLLRQITHTIYRHL